MTKPPFPQPLSRLLATDAMVAGWHARAMAEAELTSAVRRLLPRALAERVRVAEAADATLTLAATSGTIAAVVRQRLPDILGSLQREGCNFTEIRVRVQVRLEPAESAKRLKIQRERVDAAPLRRLAENLAEGPLKTAVLKLARRV
ncbi:MAG: DciA family protein [Betaproteobacteria bacterium]